VVTTVSRQAAALTKAREPRRALNAVRDEHDRRIEQATAEALVALEARQEAEQALAAATATLGEDAAPADCRGSLDGAGGRAAGSGRSPTPRHHR
jgi:hypothetical protein